MKLSLDPRTKLLILILINVVVFMSPDFVTELVCMGIIAALLLFMGAYKQTLRGVFMYAGMLVALWLCRYIPCFLSAIVSIIIQLKHE